MSVLDKSPAQVTGPLVLSQAANEAEDTLKQCSLDSQLLGLIIRGS